MNKLRELRKKHGFTLEVLAEEAGISTAYLQKMEAGTRNISLKNLRKLAVILGESVGVLAGDEGDISLGEASPSHAQRPEVTIQNIELNVYGHAAATDGRVMGLGSQEPTGQIDLNPTYAVEVSGNSMAPRYKHGEYILVVANEWPAERQDCLIQTPDGEGMVKIYIEHDKKRLIYEQLNPPEQLELAMVEGIKVEQVRGRWK